MNDFDIQVMKLDDAYSMSNNISVRVDLFQKKLLEELERIINNLKNHWHGNDATNHINSLIDEYDEHVDFFSELSDMTTFLSKYFVLLQKSRASMSEILRVGEEEEEAKFVPKKIERIDTTNEYYYDEQIKNDYKDLCNLSDLYSNFVNELDSNSKELLNNWKAGAGRAEVKVLFELFLTVSQKISKKISDLEEQMSIVIANESKIS